MKTKVFLGIGIRIIIVFSVGMFWTYIPEYLFDFFGDKIVVIDGVEDVEWGVRHCWYNIMMILLFLLSLINAVIQCVKLVERNYNTKSDNQQTK